MLAVSLLLIITSSTLGKGNFVSPGTSVPILSCSFPTQPEQIYEIHLHLVAALLISAETHLAIPAQISGLMCVKLINIHSLRVPIPLRQFHFLTLNQNLFSALSKQPTYVFLKTHFYINLQIHILCFICIVNKQFAKEALFSIQFYPPSRPLRIQERPLGFYRILTAPASSPIRLSKSAKQDNFLSYHTKPRLIVQTNCF